MSELTLTAMINLITAHAMVEERLAGELAAVHGLALNEALLLMHLERAPLHRLTRVELSKRLRLNPSTVTRMAAPMEKTGLVARLSDPRDARLAYVVLTDAGQTLIGQVRATLERRSTDIFRDRWSDADVAALGSLLGRLTASQAGDLIG